MLRQKNKKAWIIGISILSVALMISSSFGAAAEGASTPVYNPDGGDSLLALNIEGGSSPDVDLELVADENGIVDVPVYVDAVELNIIGNAGLELISGGENLARPPIFAGLDAADNILLSVVAMSVISIATIAKLIGDAFPLLLGLGVTLGTLIATGILSTFAAAVAAGSLALLTVFFAGGAIFSILDGHGFSPSLIAAIRAILVRVETVLTGIYYLIKDWVEEFDISAAIMKVNNFLDDIKDAVKTIAQTSIAGVAAIIMVFKYMKEAPNWAEIEATLVQLGLSPSEASQLVDKIQDSYDSIMDIRDAVFGAFDIFVTRGIQHLPIRNLYVVIDQSYEGGDDEYAAILKVKARSAGNEFDVQTIGIKFDGFPENPDGELPSDPMGSSTTEEELPLGGTVEGSAAAGSTGFTSR